MLQHDIRTHEKRWTEDGRSKIETIAWCVCGSWTSRVNGAYPSLLVESFLADHLVGINEARIEDFKQGLPTI